MALEPAAVVRALTVGLLLFLLLVVVNADQVERHLYGMGINSEGQLGLFDAYTPTYLMSEVSEIRSTNLFTIALTETKELFGFGYNKDLEIGIDVPQNPVPRPVKIATIPQEFPDTVLESFSVGDQHTLVITEDGSVIGFGSNRDGQLGVGKFIQPNIPMNVTDLYSKNITKVFAFGASSFALSDTGNLWAWGSNVYSQLGLPNVDEVTYYLPVEVMNTSDVETVAGGNAHTFVIFKNGTIFGMGENSRAQLGLGYSSDNETFGPIDSLNDLDVTFIFAGGYATMALAPGNKLYAFGDNTYKQLGLSGAVIENPTQLTEITGTVSDVSVGKYHTLVVTNEHVYGAGQNNRGQLGLSPAQSTISNFTKIPGLNGQDVQSVSAGSGYSVLLFKNGTVLTWGDIRYSGQGYLVDTPTLSKFKVPYNSIYAAVDFSFAIEDTLGNVWGWGSNYNRQLLDGGNFARFEHVKHPVLDGANISALTIGGYTKDDFHIFALSQNKTHYGWGLNSKYQLSISSQTRHISPIQIPNLSNQTFIEISGGGTHSIALDTTGTVKAWGDNEFFQLGLSKDILSRISPINLDTDSVSIATGYRHTIYVTGDGSVYGVGDNTYGQLGLPVNESNPYVYPKTLIPLDVNATAVFAGGRCSFILDEDGNLYAMGDNTNGALGISSNESRVSTPTLVDITITKPGLKDGTKSPLKVVTSNLDVSGHTIVLSTGGEAWVFGDNSAGQLGLKEAGSAVFTPTKLDMDELIIDVAVGMNFSLLLAGKKSCPGAPSLECGGEVRGKCDYVIGSCRCSVGYFGERCELITCEDKDNCNPPNGVCDYNTGFCNCTSSYTGSDCKLRRCPNNCSNNGQCNTTTGNCECDDGWTGDDCSSDVSFAPPRATMGAMLSVAAVVVSSVLLLAIPI